MSNESDVLAQVEKEMQRILALPMHKKMSKKSITLFISRSEWFPCYSFKPLKEKEMLYGEIREVKVPIAFFEEYKRVMAEFENMQQKMYEIFYQGELHKLVESTKD